MRRARVLAAACSTSVLCCTNTPGWTNQFGATCAEYEQEHCRAGHFLPGHEWSRGAAFDSPEKHCCACHHSPPPPPPCVDTAGWLDPYADGCAAYAAGRCAGGAFVAGEEWSRGVDFHLPEKHCCACGKPAAAAAATAAAAAAAAGCVDTPEWSNGHGAGCADYVRQCRCRGGAFLKGEEWAAGATYASPEKHCCACGKLAAGAAPPPLPPPPPPSPRVCEAVHARADLRRLRPPAWCAARSADKAACEKAFVSWDLPEGRLVSLCFYDDVYDECKQTEPRPCLAPPPPPPPPYPRRCRDTPSWTNPYRLDCGGYEKEGHCHGGHVVPGHAWALGQHFGWPELNCCVCGKPGH